MSPGKNELISVKRLHKDGTVDSDVVQRIVETLKSGGVVVLPVDSIYGIVAASNTDSENQMSDISYEKHADLVRMISSFKMLDEIAAVDKFQFDFLHRIWPGEVVVNLKMKKKLPQINTVPVRIPKTKYFIDIINNIGVPLYYTYAMNTRKQIVFRERDILKKYLKKVSLVLIIKEFSKSHIMPTVVDLTKGNLEILNKGRVSVDEMKSLYFLGRDDII